MPVAHTKVVEVVNPQWDTAAVRRNPITGPLVLLMVEVEPGALRATMVEPEPPGLWLLRSTTNGRLYTR